MNSITKKSNIERLKAMHQLIRNIDNENAYMEWIVEGIPDEPSEDDFDFIASDEEEYNDCVNLFKEIIEEYL